MGEALIVVVFLACLGIAGMVSESVTARRCWRLAMQFASRVRRALVAAQERRIARAWQGDSERGFWGC